VHGSAEKPIQVHLDASRTGRRFLASGLRPSARNDQGAYRGRSQKEQGPHRPRRQPLMQPERVRVIRVIRV